MSADYPPQMECGPHEQVACTICWPDAPERAPTSETTTYRVVGADGRIVREGLAVIHASGFGAELRYEDLRDLPVGEYRIEPGPIKLTVIPVDQVG